MTKETPKSNSDSLGEIGETTFSNICARANLVCNKSSRDRTGWDFSVEFPMIADSETRLDARKAPLSCLVQVKALWEGNDKIRFRVSSLELLAKSRRPSFVYAIIVSRDDQRALRAYLIEMRGPILGDLLKKLRKLEARGKEKVNRTNMPISATKFGIQQDLSPSSFRRSIAAAIGNDLLKYEEEKAAELLSLGFKRNRYTLSMNFALEKQSDWIDLFLGRRSVNTQTHKHFETRFGIPLEMPAPKGEVEVHIEPQPFDSCSIIARVEGALKPIVLAGEIFITPPAGEIEPAFLIKTAILEILFHKDNFQITSGDFEAQHALLPVAAWKAHFVFAEMLSRTGAELEIRPLNPAIGSFPIPGTVKVTSNADFWRSMSEAVDYVSSFLARSAIVDLPPICCHELIEIAGKLSMFEIVLGWDKSRSWVCSVPSAVWDGLAVPQAALVIDYIGFRGRILAVSGQASLSRSEVSGNDVKFEDWHQCEIRLMTPSDYLPFVERIERATKVNFRFVRDIRSE